MPCFSSFRDGVGERGSRANPAEKRYHCDGRTSRVMVLVYRRPSVVMWMEGSVRATAAAVSSRHPSKVKLVTGAGRELIPCVFFVVTTLHRDVMCSDFVTSFNSHRVPPLLPTSVSLALSHHPVSVALTGWIWPSLLQLLLLLLDINNHATPRHPSFHTCMWSVQQSSSKKTTAAATTSTDQKEATVQRSGPKNFNGYLPRVPSTTTVSRVLIFSPCRRVYDDALRYDGCSVSVIVSTTKHSSESE